MFVAGTKASINPHPFFSLLNRNRSTMIVDTVTVNVLPCPIFLKIIIQSHFTSEDHGDRAWDFTYNIWACLNHSVRVVLLLRKFRSPLNFVNVQNVSVVKMENMEEWSKLDWLQRHASCRQTKWRENEGVSPPPFFSFFLKVSRSKTCTMWNNQSNSLPTERKDIMWTSLSLFTISTPDLLLFQVQQPCKQDNSNYGSSALNIWLVVLLHHVSWIWFSCTIFTSADLVSLHHIQKCKSDITLLARLLAPLNQRLGADIINR